MARNVGFSLGIGLMLFASFGLVSCDRDGVDEGNGSPNAGVIDTTTGLRVTSACFYDYAYDAEGRLQSAVFWDYWGGNWDLTYNPNTIRYTLDKEVLLTASVRYNSHGWVSAMNASSSWDDDEDKGSGKASKSIDYDSQGRISKIVATEQGTYYDKETRSHGADYFKVTYTYTWKDGLLEKIVVSSSLEERYDGEKSENKGEATLTFTYEEPSIVNRYSQYAPSFWPVSLGFSSEVDETPMLLYVGLLGYSPSALPSKTDYHYAITSTENGITFPEESSATCEWTYSFNDDGSLASAQYIGTGIDFDGMPYQDTVDFPYSYENASANVKAKPAAKFNLNRRTITSKKDFFRHHALSTRRKTGRQL